MYIYVQSKGGIELNPPQDSSYLSRIHYYIYHYQLQIMSHFVVFHMLAVQIFLLKTSFLDHIEIVFVI